MRFASLGSGSEGNGLVVEAGATRILMDCGFAVRDAERRLARLGLKPEDIHGVVVTHEHSDHISGVFRFAARCNIPVWLTWGTFQAAHALHAAAGRNAPPTVNLIDGHSRFSIGDIEVEPYPVPHDAREPVQYVFSDGAFRLGVLTDVGMSTSHIERTLSGCNALLLECNHDLDLLKNSDYPYSLKKRISGRYGHLDNGTAAQLLAALDCSKLQHLLAAHLSRQNNTPDKAREALASVMNCAKEWIGLADQNEGFDWLQMA